MGRTIPSITQVYYHELASFSRFRRALRRGDQIALDDLLTSAQKHLAAAAFAAHAAPFEIFLLAMLLEEHKEVMRLREFAALRLGVVGEKPAPPAEVGAAGQESDDD